MLQNFSPQNTYQGLLSLKKQLGDSIDRQSDSLNAFQQIISGEDDFSHLQSVTFSSADSEFVANVYVRTSNDLLLRLYDSETHEELFNDHLSPQDFIDGVSIGNTNLTTDNLVVSLNNNAKVNEMYSDINDLFLTKTKVDISVISSTIESYKSSIPNEASHMLFNLSQITDDENKVSQTGFMEILKTNLSYGKKAGTDEKFSFDTVDPYVIVGFANVVMGAVYSVIATVFATLLTICNKLLGLLAAVIIGIVNIWIKAKEVYGELNIDQNQPVWHITGAVRSCSFDWINGCNKDGSLNNDLMTVTVLPGCELYTWLEGKGTSPMPKKGLRQQVYVTLNVHPDRFMEYVRLSTNFRTYDTSPRFSITNAYFMRETNDVNPDSQIEQIKNKIWLTEDELTQLNVDGEFLRRTIAANLMAYCLCHLRIGGEFAIENALDEWPVSILNGLHCAPGIGMTAMSEFSKKHHDDSYEYFHDWTLEHLSEVHQALFGVTAYLTNSYRHPLTESTNIQIVNSGNVTVGYGYTNAFHGFSRQTYQEGSNLPASFFLDQGNIAGYSQDIDYYPVSPKVTLPALDFDNLRKCLIAVGVALTAAMLVYKVTNTVIKKRTYFSRIKAAKDLQTKYDAALQDDTPENRKAFFKARRIFNIKSKIFGWDSYDPTNKWWDPRESTTAVLSQNNSFGTNNQISDGFKTIKDIIVGI